MAKSDVLVRMMADTKNYDANIAKARRQLDQFKKDNLSLGGVLRQTSSSLLGMAAQYASVAAAIGAVGGAITNNISTAKNFEKSMSQLSSLTGMVGDDLNQLKEYAIELGSSTTLSASQVADAFKLIGSQQPQLLSSGQALKDVTKQAITLAEAAGIDLATAAQTLSTSVNQMGGDSENAARFVNVLAAASQQGAGDIAWLGEAITKSGTTAKAVGTSYEELVANLEQLAKAGFDASTAGTALRSIIMNLEKQANKDFKPSVVGLTTAFENLGKANMSVVGYQEIAGKMFASQAMALADAAGEARKMTDAITGTNTAEQQAKTNTDNLDGSLKSLSSAWEGLNLHINSSNGLLRDGVELLTGFVRKVDAVYQKLERFYNKFGWMLTPSQQGARESFMQLASQKYGNAAAAPTSGTPATVIPVPAPAAGGGGSGGGGGGTSSKKTNVMTIADFEKSIAKAGLGAGGLKGSDDKNFMSVWAMSTEEAKRSMLGLADATVDLGSAMADLGDKEVLKEIEQMNKNLENQKTAFNMAAQAASQFGAALAGIEDPSARAAGTVIQAIANIVLGFSAAAAQASSMGPYGWIAYLAAGLGATATAISTIHSLTGYTEGGIVEGNSYSGDNIYAGEGMVNAGELVLSKAAQGNLASQLSGENSGVHIIGELQGEKILLAVNRYLSRNNKGELVTW
jgi:TP901 family phage tail tape measure protein